MKHDYTRGSPGKNILLLGVPMSMEMLLLSIYNLADLFFISFLGKEAMAGVGLSCAILLIPIAVSMGLANASHILVSRRIGEQDLSAACTVLGQSFWISVTSGIVLGAIGYVLATPSLIWLGASEDVVAGGCGYLEVRHLWMFLGNLLFGFNSCIRAAGNAKTALSVLAISNAVNIALDPIFIFGLWRIPKYGTSGAAYATIIAYGVGVAVQFAILLRGTDRLRLSLEIFRLHLKTAVQILRLSAVTIPHCILRYGSELVLNALVACYGTTVVAGFSIAIRFNLFACMPIFGISNAIATLIGQNLGAREPERARLTSRLGICYCMVYMVLIGTLFFWGAPWFLGWMSPTPEVLAEAVYCLRLLALSYPFAAVGSVVNFTFLGAGDARTPLALDVVNRWLCRIGGGYLLSCLSGIGGVWIAACAAEAAHCAIGYYLYRKGKWTAVKV